MDMKIAFGDVKEEIKKMYKVRKRKEFQLKEREMREEREERRRIPLNCVYN